MGRFWQQYAKHGMTQGRLKQGMHLLGFDKPGEATFDIPDSPAATTQVGAEQWCSGISSFGWL
jgi:hypothetical protein